MLVTVGHSEDLDSHDAITEVLADCASRLGGLTPTAGLLFAGIDHDFQVLADTIVGRYPDIQLVGCSTDGEISSVFGFAEDSVALMLFASDRIRIRAGLGRGVGADPVTAAREAVESLEAGADDTRLCILVGEGIGVNSQRLIAAVQAELPPGAVVCGGMAGDQERFEGTVQIVGDQVLSDSVCLLTFSGPLLLSQAVNSGWKPLGTPHRVSHSEGNVVHAIDGRPPGELYDQYFGGYATMIPIALFPEPDGQFHLNVFQRSGDGTFFTDTDIPEGTVLQFADATVPEVIQAAAETSDTAVRNFAPASPEAGILFSCAGRRLTLGTKTGEEIGQLQSRLPDGIPLIGFYTYGEICPLPGQTVSRFHGYTFVTVLIGEDWLVRRVPSSSLPDSP